MSTHRVPLPLVGQEPVERADAVRNRRKILDAATRMIAANGAGSLSLDEVARSACVGVGTVYRRFRDRAGLVSALVDDREQEFQRRFMSGPPPLGPGAPPAERLRAFLHGLLDHIVEQADLFLLGETSSPTARFVTGPYQVRHVHLVMLINQIRPEAHAHFLADALQAPLAPSLLNHHRQVAGFSVERIKAGIDDLIGWAGLAPK